ncbi:hypothetical protein TNCV_504631 [Trichonephila clavipes]|nr:hypothetical protein TNCV_504631 [Trichonephila clavipes]
MQGEKQLNSSVGTKQLNSTGENNSTRQHERNNSTGENNSTQQQERTTQLVSRNETTQLSSRNETTQLVSRNETTQLCTAVDRLRPPATAYTAYNRLHRLHRLYSRIGFFYLLIDHHESGYYAFNKACFCLIPYRIQCIPFLTPMLSSSFTYIILSLISEFNVSQMIFREVMEINPPVA